MTTPAKLTFPPKLYLAARFGRADEIDEVAEAFRDAGLEVTSRWHSGQHGDPNADVDLTVPDMPRYAREDFTDLFRANVVVSFSSDGQTGRGGRHVEFGLGLAWGKRLVLVGPIEHVFHTLPEVERVEDYLDVIDLLTGEAS